MQAKLVLGMASLADLLKIGHSEKNLTLMPVVSCSAILKKYCSYQLLKRIVKKGSNTGTKATDTLDAVSANFLLLCNFPPTKFCAKFCSFLPFFANL